MSRAFKVGDKVKVRTDLDIPKIMAEDRSPGWNDSMTELVGCVGVVVEIDLYYCVRVTKKDSRGEYRQTWKYRKEWLTSKLNDVVLECEP